MTERKCARCNERYSLSYRAGRNTCRARPGRKRVYHQGRRYCSDTCRKLASKDRVQALKSCQATTPLINRHQRLWQCRYFNGLQGAKIGSSIAPKYVWGTLHRLRT
jgi:hypothetical protein